MAKQKRDIHKTIDKAVLGLRSLLVSRQPAKVEKGLQRELNRLVDGLGTVQAGFYMADEKDLDIMRLVLHAGKVKDSDQFPLICAPEDLQWALELLGKGNFCCIAPGTDGCIPQSPQKSRLFRSNQQQYAVTRGNSSQKQFSLLVIEYAASADLPKPKQHELMVHMTQVFTNVIIHSQVLSVNQTQIEFEQLLSDLSRAFINLPGQKIDDAIETGLKRIALFFDIERASLFQIIHEHPKGVLTHLYARTGLKQIPAGEEVTAEDFPYVRMIQEKGEAFHFKSLDELPKEAETDKASYKRWDIVSNLSIPLFAAGEILGTIAFNSTTREISWPTTMINRAFVIGEIFANALARKSADEGLRQSYAEIKELKDRLQSENMYFQKEIKLQHNFDEIIGESEALKYVLLKIEQCAPTDATVILLGETGTGKELIARAIHDKSLRNEHPLIKVDCGTLQSTMIERELFGHEKGAFTNAHQKQVGRFEIAHEGTLFLDEIGELPLGLQPKLLRAIQDGEFERLGSPVTHKVDVRIIAATNRDLEKEVGEGRFRRDLWYRLNVFPITIPPLRERKEDIPLLVNWFVNKYSKKMGKHITSIPQQTLDQLTLSHWAGNIRELENTIERAVIISIGDTLSLADAFECEALEKTPTYANMALEDVEREHIANVLKETNGRISGPKGAARILKINPSTLRFRMKKLGIDKTNSHA